MISLLLPLVLCFLVVSESSAPTTSPSCQRTCGNISIPYPFGMGHPTCFRDKWFEIKCNESSTTPKAFLMGQNDLELLNISLQGHLSLRSWMSQRCYNQDGNVTFYQTASISFISGSPYRFSNTRNKFTAIGCDMQSYVEGFMGTRQFRSGCMSYCSSDNSTVIGGSCTGIGCCQFAVPRGLEGFEVFLDSLGNQKIVWGYNPCRYTFLAEQDEYVFASSDLSGSNLVDRSRNLSVVVDWVVGNDLWNNTCEVARANMSSYACRSENSDCYISSNGPGYRCNCSLGYEGNPYVDGGCQDINECRDKDNNPCIDICINTPGNYSCSCPKGTHGDGRKDGDGCTKYNKEFPVLKVVLGTGFSLLFLLIGSTWTHWIFKKRKLMQLKEKFFQQNGGLMLQKKISYRVGAFKIFTTEELERATENYSINKVIGQGGYGIVYKGTLTDNRIVAIKKSKIFNGNQIEQFINEVDILSQINHRNVVKLLGCCLETEVPLLVYEFVSNGTLYSHIHDANHASSISLENRLRIATETAEALAYLHSAASMPIFHRDIKSANILLDHNYTAKVSDFGASRLIPNDQTQITTLVQGTLGYLDPEYFQTGQLTAKSDVYSFGVVLVELLTGEKPLSFNRSEEEINLSMYFISAMKGNRLFEVLEDRILNEGQEEQLMAIAHLAERCMEVKGEERPTMKEVAVELQGLRRFHDHPWINNNIHEGTQSLLHEPLEGSTGEASRQYSLEDEFIVSLEHRNSYHSYL
ncbi:putative wall-associated receptor kinase-like protein 16 [Cinnamomum micranthum f. kanehirae]|uniref:Putative wall-associated receptor kinase-like protein 16 n=1 Tax=Cinnamomum micranthum f. kanehirae TaxID=337451 RepID=A0A443PAZ1_9MAGN|nr:putative wall-associated receptor kinase-like protein 16 [Cinnamomum micranthum f. kanehirae]